MVVTHTHTHQFDTVSVNIVQIERIFRRHRSTDFRSTAEKAEIQQQQQAQSFEGKHLAVRTLVYGLFLPRVQFMSIVRQWPFYFIFLFCYCRLWSGERYEKCSNEQIEFIRWTEQSNMCFDIITTDITYRQWVLPYTYVVSMCVNAKEKEIIETSVPCPITFWRNFLRFVGAAVIDDGEWLSTSTPTKMPLNTEWLHYLTLQQTQCNLRCSLRCLRVCTSGQHTHTW